MKIQLTKRRKQWWISTDDDEFGPYNDKREALEDARVLELFYKHYVNCPGGNKCKCSKPR